MSREVRRVPLDFDWPLNKVWSGYLMPDRLHGEKCPDCENGYSSRAQHLHSLWYGYVPFDPAATGSTPLTPGTPAVRAFAERHIKQSPDFYGRGEAAIVREGLRLASLWNGMWSHHVAQADVDALVAAGRLMDFTHTWVRGSGWQPKDPAPEVTAAQVNEWAIRTIGHDSINASIAVRARCEREGVEETCPRCDGHASVEVYPGQRAEAEAWEPAEPPMGDDWQLWETVSDGSPVTPVFASAEALITHLEWREGWRRSAAEQLVSDGSTAGSFFTVGRQMFDSGKDADIAANRVADLPEHGGVS